MPIYKKNNKYFAVVNYVGLNGKYKKVQSKYFETKKEAQESEIELRQRFKNCDKYSITFKDAYDEFRYNKTHEIKIQSVLKLDQLFTHIEPLYKIKVEKLSLQQYKVFKDTLDKNENLSTARKNKVHRLVCTIIDYCNQNYGIYNDIPRRAGGFKSHEIKKEMQFFTLDEFNKFIDAIDDEMYKTLFLLLFYNGLRIGEALALTWNDFKDEHLTINKTLVVRVKGREAFKSSPKTPKSNRVLPVNDTVNKALKGLKSAYMEYPHFSEDWYIFGGIKALNEGTVTNVKNKACEVAKVKPIRIHDFRHSCASYYINHKNAPIILISKLLGHSKISITLDTYSHLYPNELDILMKK